MLYEVELCSGFEVDDDLGLGKDGEVDPKLAIDSIGLFFGEVP